MSSKFLNGLKTGAVAVSSVASSVMFSMINGIRAFALGDDLTVDGIIEESSDSGTLDPLVNQTKSLGASGYTLIYTIMVFIFIIGFVIAFIKLFFSNSSERTEAKGDMVWKIVAGVCGFAAIGLVILLATIGSGLFTS